MYLRMKVINRIAYKMALKNKEKKATDRNSNEKLIYFSLEFRKQNFPVGLSISFAFTPILTGCAAG